MKQKSLYLMSAVLLVLFVLLTVLLPVTDVSAIGPNGSSVGFSSINGPVHSFFGVHMGLYTVTDWAGLVPVLLALGFAAFGLMQWVKRKRLLAVDADILVLGCFYILVGAAYMFFESYCVNRRPVLIEGMLETSYPSSTTMLALTVMSAAVMQFSARIRNRGLRIAVITLCTAFTAFMVIGRLVSGVHWATDILGGILVSAALMLLYAGVCKSIAAKRKAV